MTIFDSYSRFDQSIARSQEVTRRIENSVRGRNEPLHKACVDFEAIFVKQMLNAMRKTVDKSSLLDGSLAQEIFEDLLYDEYAQKMAQSGSFGLAELIYDRLAEGL